MDLSTLTLGDLLGDHPVAERVLARHAITLGQGGRQRLAEACAARGLEPQAILDEVLEAERLEAGEAPDWGARPLGELVQHIMLRFHGPHHTELPRLESLAQKVRDRHGERDERLLEIAPLVTELRIELEAHMALEERVVFPPIRSGEGLRHTLALQTVALEHDRALELMAKLRELTGSYTPPPTSCRSWTLLWNGLEAFEAALGEHVRLEMVELFPRAILR